MSENLTPKQVAAVEVLAEGGTREKAAQAAGVSLRTVKRWAQQPEVYEAIRARTTETLDQATRIAVDGLPYATAIPRRIMQDEAAPDAIRLRAAAMVVDNAIRLLEIRDIQTQLDELRQAVGLGE